MIVTDYLKNLKSELNSSLNSKDKRAKIQDADFITSLLQAVAKMKGNFSLSELRLCVCAFVGVTIGTSSFNARMATASLTSQLQRILEFTLSKLYEKHKNSDADKLAQKLGVQEIIGIDGSIVSLWDGLSEHFKGTFTTASVKLHLAINLVSGSVSWYSITPGSTHDSKCFPDIIDGNMYIFDLGYWSTKLFKIIDEKSAFFLCRVKSNASITVVNVVYGIGQSIVGEDLLGYTIKNKRGDIIELIGTLAVGKSKKEYRVLGFWNKKSRSYHWYVTNSSVSRSLIYQIYRLRWQIELSFKSMKSTLNFDRMPSLSENAINSFVLIALINYSISILIKQDAEDEAKNKKTASIQKAVKLFRELVPSIMKCLKLGKKFSKKKIELLEYEISKLTDYLFDPNHKNRKLCTEKLLQS